MNPVLESALGNRTTAWALLFLAAYGEGPTGLPGPMASR